LIRRHVDVHRTFALAAFAGEAEIERVLDVRVLPAPSERVTVQHLEEQARASARRVCLLPSGPVARAHRPALVPAAFADADTPNSREREAPMVLWKPEVRHWLRGLIVGAQTQILIDAVRIDDLAWIHQAVGIPDALELTERVHQLWPEHLRQEFRFGLPVAMFARERAAVRDDERARVIHERFVFLDAGRRF